MPFANLETKKARDRARMARKRDEERKRKAAPRESTPTTFDEWLRFIVEGHELRSSLSASKSKVTLLAEHLGKDDTVIARWIKGQRKPSEDDTFAIGLALHECGVPSVCGSYALRIAGFWGEELAFLDYVSRASAFARSVVTSYLTAVDDEHFSIRAATVAELARLELELRHAFKRRPKASTFGLLGAVHHLAFNSNLDPRDVADACDALITKWRDRPVAQNLEDAFAAKFGIAPEGSK